MNLASSKYLGSLINTFLAAASILAVEPAVVASARAAQAFQPTVCEGAYTNHLQGICTDQREAIFWSWTDALVKTDLRGRILKQVKVANHHGDLCFVDGRIYVAVNLGKFNQPAGSADSWVYVYHAETLAELARHRTPELVHGAGGIAYLEGKFIVVGGLPVGVNENYVYEYDAAFAFQKRHVLASGYTLMGIQTATFANGSWWFGCYGNPRRLLRADESFIVTGNWEFDASLGIVGLADGRFLIGQNTRTKGVGHQGRVVVARADAEKGLVFESEDGVEQKSPARPNTTQGWVKSPKNPLLALGQEGDFDSQNIVSPAVVKDGGRYFLFYAGGPSGPKTGGEFVRYQLGLALSDDGETWTKTGKPLVPLGERDDFHVTPALLRDPAGSLAKRDGLWHMVYCGNRADDVEHATSRDGLHWDKDARNPIYKSAYAPNLVQFGPEIRMYYVHKPTMLDGKSPPWEIHLATGRNFYSFKPHPSNPVLTLSDSWEKNHLFYPYVLRENDTWVMFYAAYWRNHPNSASATAIGMATSRDGVSWTKSPANPVLTPTPGSAYDSIYTSSQSVLRDGDHYRMYYASRIDMLHKYYAIGLANNRGRLVFPPANTEPIKSEAK